MGGQESGLCSIWDHGSQNVRSSSKVLKFEARILEVWSPWYQKSEAPNPRGLKPQIMERTKLRSELQTDTHAIFVRKFKVLSKSDPYLFWPDPIESYFLCMVFHCVLNVDSKTLDQISVSCERKHHVSGRGFKNFPSTGASKTFRLILSAGLSLILNPSPRNESQIWGAPTAKKICSLTQESLQNDLTIFDDHRLDDFSNCQIFKPP